MCPSHHAKKEALLSDLGSVSFQVQREKWLVAKSLNAVRIWKTAHSGGQADEKEALFKREGRFFGCSCLRPQAPSSISSRTHLRGPEDAATTQNARKNPGPGGAVPDSLIPQTPPQVRQKGRWKPRKRSASGEVHRLFSDPPVVSNLQESGWSVLFGLSR